MPKTHSSLEATVEAIAGRAANEIVEAVRQIIAQEVGQIVGAAAASAGVAKTPRKAKAAPATPAAPKAPARKARKAPAGKVARSCPIPGCTNPSTGPRFSWFCAEHRTLSAAEKAHLVAGAPSAATPPAAAPAAETPKAEAAEAAPKKRGRKPGSKNKPGPKPTKAKATKGKFVRRTPDQIAAVQGRLLGFIKDHPGLNTEAIVKVLGGDANEIKDGLSRLRDERKVTTKGVKRAMAYTAV